jgi:hypothetical protein
MLLYGHSGTNPLSTIACRPGLPTIRNAAAAGLKFLVQYIAHRRVSELLSPGIGKRSTTFGEIRNSSFQGTRLGYRLTMHVDVTRCVTDVLWSTSRLGQGLGFQFWMTVMGAVLASSVTVFIRNR